MVHDQDFGGDFLLVDLDSQLLVKHLDYHTDGVFPIGRLGHREGGCVDSEVPRALEPGLVHHHRLQRGLSHLRKFASVT